MLVSYYVRFGFHVCASTNVDRTQNINRKKNSMEKIRLLIIVSLIALAITSCKEDEEVVTTNINAKWNVSATSSPYKSFEFTESGNYLVTTNAGTKSTDQDIYIFGSYSAVAQTLTLKDFGTIEINELTSNNVSFTLKLDSASADPIEITATKADEMDSDTKTDLLCRSWDMYKINGKTAEGTSAEATVFFSKAGTYFIEFKYPDEIHESGMALWKWSDSNQTKFCYSWGETITCDENNQVEVVEVTQSSLKLQQIFSSDEGGDDEYDVYELTLADNNKSASVNTIINQNSALNKSGFLYRQKK